MSEASPRRLEQTPAELREAIRIVGDALLTWHARVRSLAPAGTAHDPLTQGAKWRQAVAGGPPPEEGTDLESLVRRVVDDLAPDAQVVGHPGFLGYVAGAGNLVSALGQALAMALNPYTGTSATAPAFVRLEDEVVRWFTSIVGYPPEAGGFLTTGSSLAILSAVVAARERAKAPWEKARCYVGDQTHHALGKALFAAGFPPEATVLLPSRDLRMDPGLLDDRLAADRARGLVPVIVVGTAGTTNAGRVDPLGDLAEVAARHGAWFHCDAAYGGFFRLLPEATCLAGMERADSISLDPHKSLSLPYGTGALLARDVAALRFPRGLPDSYMPPVDEDLRYEYSDLGPELSRDFRGLRVWLAVRHFGIAPFRENLREKWRLARRLAEEVRATPTLELVTAPDLSILTFRVRDDPTGRKTRALLARVNGGGRFFLTSCTLPQGFVVRVCLLGFRCDAQVVDRLVATLRGEAARVGEGGDA